MSRKISYVWIALGIVLTVIVGDFISYRMVLNKMDSMQTDYEQRVSELVEVDVTKQLENKAEEVVERIVENNTESVTASTGKETLNVNTVYQVQKYDVQKDTTATDYETLPQDLVGFTREQADTYFKEYMNRLPVEEYLDGLQSIGIVSFSAERLVVKRIYDSSKVEYRFYLIAVDGEVVVYYGDKKTVYEYTGIETKNLSKEERTMLKKGLEVKDEQELYGILENYSS
ncbi:hypothetical protein D7V86_11325 [bacterium D16-51]|nr:hypothetical protein D7V96_12845 [bacterium D16-59]RKI59761.1 hypothetical protein D7V86_11325 [bacterium D16-51]